MFREDLKEKLNKWCEDCCTRYSRVYFIEEEDTIIVKRHDGLGIANITATFKSNLALELFLKESNHFENILTQYNNVMDKIMDIEKDSLMDI